MLTLGFHKDHSAEPAVFLQVPAVRLAGPALWDRELGLIAYCADSSWKHAGESYSRVSLAGPCRLLFGLQRDPNFLSETLEALTLVHQTLRANGVAFARYSAQSGFWHGTRSSISWASFLVASEAIISAYVDLTRAIIRNPWDSPEIPYDQIRTFRDSADQAWPVSRP